ncbi:MAG: hypothetical protein MI861_05350, partial [Pirellulales bacterium]|nr:hypothetical protein [Pirellulales bacterium]
MNVLDQCEGHRAVRGTAVRLVILAILLGTWGGPLPARGDEPPGATELSELVVGRRTVPLPAQLPSGKTVRPIALFQSQVVDLVPDHYRPVSIQRLRQAIAQLTDRSEDDQTSRLRSAVYWIRVVDGVLVSDRLSTIDIETDQQGVVRRSLGKVNLAIVQPQRRESVDALNQLPRLESDSDGDLSVVFQARSNVRSVIEFKWRLRGESVGS